MGEAKKASKIALYVIEDWRARHCKRGGEDYLNGDNEVKHDLEYPSQRRPVR